MSTQIAVIETAIVAPAKDLASQALAMRVANSLAGAKMAASMTAMSVDMGSPMG